MSSDLLPGVPLIESPFFQGSLQDTDLSAEQREIATQLSERGYAVIDFPDVQIDTRIERIKASLEPRFDIDFSDKDSIKNKGGARIQDAWQFDEDVRAIAANAVILSLLGKLYGRRAFPFQTLNFPVGTQQHMHSDAVHFSSIPERFMCGVWLAMEDISEDAGPLLYYPGSHKWPILNNEMLGRPVDTTTGAQEPYEAAWRALVDTTNTKPMTFCAKKGQALIWAANLLHGGSKQNDLTLTRWSQVTHYYFENCSYYTPAYSISSLGQLHLRSIEDIRSGTIVENVYLNQTIDNPREAPKTKKFSLGAIGGYWRKSTQSLQNIWKGLPSDFDPERYLYLNRDVARAGQNARQHYQNHGKLEGRRYK